MQPLPIYWLLFYTIINLKYVQSRIIHVDFNNILSNHSGDTWGSSFNELQIAINYANNNDEIWITRGIYYGGFNITNKNHIKIIGGFYGNETSINHINYEITSNDGTVL